MENDEYQALTRDAVKGYKQSLKELFLFGEKLLAVGRFEEAASVFREAAICYRISAFRNSAATEDAEGHINQRQLIIDQYHTWVEKHQSSFSPLPRIVDGMTFEFIRTTVLNAIEEDGHMFQIMRFTCIAFENHGMEWFGPGGSQQRSIIWQLAIYFGLRDYQDNYLQYTDVRIGLDLLADEVEMLFMKNQVA
jgi:hypothetical protein